MTETVGRSLLPTFARHLLDSEETEAFGFQASGRPPKYRRQIAMIDQCIGGNDEIVGQAWGGESCFKIFDHEIGIDVAAARLFDHAGGQIDAIEPSTIGQILESFSG